MCDVKLEPREECLQLVVDASLLVREAAAIAAALPDEARLHAELKDARGILAQATTRLLEGRARDQYQGLRAATCAEIAAWPVDDVRR
jgi:hypothetical protein